MIETLMIFALGFLAATLLALLIIPALNARAERLARRRVEALFPLSIDELTAEKDHLRAEFAVLQRGLERKAEEALGARQADMEESGRRTLRLQALEATLGQREEGTRGLEADLEETRRRLAAGEQDLAGSRASLANTRDTLAALEAAHRAILGELETTRDALQTTTATLATTRTELDGTRERLARREAEYADLQSRHNAALGELDTKRITISDLETRLATQISRGDDFERALGDRRSELSTERQRLADLAKGLVSEQERGLALEQRIRALEGERESRAAAAARAATDLAELRTARTKVLATLDERTAALHQTQDALSHAQTRLSELTRRGGVEGAAEGAARSSELRALSERLEVQRAEKSALEGALAAARDERARLERALAQQRREGQAGSDRILAENADLRRRIDEVADEILRRAQAQPESGGSADANDRAGEAPRRRRRTARPAATA